MCFQSCIDCKREVHACVHIGTVVQMPWPTLLTKLPLSPGTPLLVGWSCCWLSQSIVCQNFMFIQFIALLGSRKLDDQKKYQTVREFKNEQKFSKYLLFINFGFCICVTVMHDKVKKKYFQIENASKNECNAFKKENNTSNHRTGKNMCMKFGGEKIGMCVHFCRPSSLLKALRSLFAGKAFKFGVLTSFFRALCSFLEVICTLHHLLSSLH